MVSTEQLAIVYESANPMEAVLALNYITGGLFFSVFLVVIVLIIFFTAKSTGASMPKCLLGATWTGALLGGLGAILRYVDVGIDAPAVPIQVAVAFLIIAGIATALVAFEK